MATATTPLNYQGSTDPKKVAANNRLLIANQAQNLYGQGADLTAATKQRQDEAQSLVDQSGRIYGTENAQRGGTADYLGAIEDPLAKGLGGYNPAELEQIRMTPEQQQQMVTGAGISAGTATAAATDAAQRATNAAGGNPAAQAAYRARAASNIGAQAGDAQTQARIAASNAAATRAKAIGDTRIGQQTQGLNYYQGQNAQANQNAQNALGLQQQAQGLKNQATGLQSQALQDQNQTYGTETGGVNQAAQTAQAASQNPTTFDKVMGGVSGALAFLEDGDIGGEQAVIGENGPEAVVKLRPGYKDGGDIGSGEVDQEGSGLPTDGMSEQGGSGEANPRSWMQRMMTKARAGAVDQQQQRQQQPQAQPQQQGMAPSVKSWNTVGQGVAKLASFLEDGEVTPSWRTHGSTVQSYLDAPMGEAVAGQSYRAMGGAPQRTAEMFNEDGGVATPKPFGTAPGVATGPMGSIITKPTKVTLGKDDAVVPLSYRARAKARPSMAMPLVQSMQRRPVYGRV